VKASPGTVAKGWLLDRVLSRFGAPRERHRRRERAQDHEPLAPARGRLVTAMAAFFVVGMPAMLLFEAPITRFIGVLCIFGFIITGVFAIARPEFLDPE
jgi:hypothetical protein